MSRPFSWPTVRAWTRRVGLHPNLPARFLAESCRQGRLFVNEAAPTGSFISFRWPGWKRSGYARWVASIP